MNARNCSLIQTMLFLPLLLAATVLPAQSRTETIRSARVAWLQSCIVAGPHVAFGTGEGAFGTVLAKLAGDVLGAGVNALGDALERASREQAFSAEGLARFSYYMVEIDEKTNRANLRTSFDQSNGCLVLSSQYSNKQAGLNDGKEARTNAALDSEPQLYIELRLISTNDGFYVQPAYLAYSAALPGAPTKSAPAELHVSFSVPAPASENGGRGTVFAVAQIKLPALTPGTVLDANELRSLGSAYLAHRNRGGLETEVAQLQSRLDAPGIAEANVAAAERKLKRAEERLKAAADAKAIPALKSAVWDARDALEDRKLELADAERLQEAALRDYVGENRRGSVTAQVRFSVIRDANKFGLAIAQALKNRSTEFGAALATQLTAPPAPAWTAADTAYIQATSAVNLAELALSSAQAGGDPVAIRQAELALRNSQAAANQAAVAAGRPLPYPALRN